MKEPKYAPQEFLDILDEEIERILKMPEDERPFIITIPGTNVAFFNPL